MRPEIVPSACRSSSLPRCCRLIGDSAIVAPRRFSMAKKSPVTSFTASLASRPLATVSKNSAVSFSATSTPAS